MVQLSEFTPEQQEQVTALAKEIAREELIKIWSGQGNIQQIVPRDLVYRGKGVYYSNDEGWFTKGPGGSLLKLPGPPAGV